jgi:hypothetical protein
VAPVPARRAPPVPPLPVVAPARPAAALAPPRPAAPAPVFPAATSPAPALLPPVALLAGLAPEPPEASFAVAAPAVECDPAAALSEERFAGPQATSPRSHTHADQRVWIASFMGVNAAAPPFDRCAQKNEYRDPPHRTTAATGRSSTRWLKGCRPAGAGWTNCLRDWGTVGGMPLVALCSHAALRRTSGYARASVLLMLTVLLICASLARAQTQGPAHGGTLQITYEAPSECPSRAEFEARLRARLPTGDWQPRVATMRLHVRLELLDGRARGRIVIRNAGGATTRQIDTPTCVEAVDGLALIAALALESTANTRPPADVQRGTPPLPASPPTAAGTARSYNTPGADGESNDGQGVGSAAITRPSVADPRDSRTQPGVVEPRNPSTHPDAVEPRNSSTHPDAVEPRNSSTHPEALEPRSDEGQPAALDPRSDEEQPATLDPRSSRDAQPSSTRVTVVAAALAILGVAPNLGPGLQLGASLRLAQFSSLDLSVRVAARMAFVQHLSHPQGNADFRFWGAAIALCASPTQWRATTSLHACAAFEPGLLVARGRDTLEPAGYTRAWAALGPAVWLEWGALGALSVQTGCELLFPLLRERFLLADAVVHRPAGVGLRLGLGLGVRFP